MFQIKKFFNRLLKLIKYRHVLKNISDTFVIITNKTSLTKRDLYKAFCDNITNIPDKELFILNYKYLLNLVLNDIDEINHRIKDLKNQIKKSHRKKIIYIEN